MALPDIIEELFGALYESQTGILNDKAQALARYEEILNRALTQFGCSRPELLKLIMPRYHRWIRENKLQAPKK